MTPDPRFETIELPANTTEPTSVVFAARFDTPPTIITAYDGPEEFDPIEVTEIGRDGFKIRTPTALPESLTVQWTTQETSRWKR